MFVVRPAETAAGRDQCYLLRIEVFVREQNVPMELELDHHDEADALHFLGLENDVPVATARVLLTDGVARIQRVAVAASHRGKAYGRKLMLAIIDHIGQHNLAGELVLDAQAYALSFYENLGFTAEGEEFDDAGIPHKKMRRPVVPVANRSS